MTRYEDTVSAFQLEGAVVRGRYAMLGAASIDPILRRHDYPRPAALLLGEALTLAALIGALLKVEGRLSVQAEGEGAVRLLVAEWRSDGGMRGYVRLSQDAAQTLTAAHALTPKTLLGGGVLTITLDQGPDMDLMQGVVPLEGDTLAACAEHYFQQSEQTPTRIRLAVAEELAPGRGPLWRAGGALIQRIAGDGARGDAEEDWNTAQHLFATLEDHELADPELGPEQVLYRLFHEGGVRLAEPGPLADFCPCDRARLAALLKRFTTQELADLVEPDGAVHAKCQFCARLYVIAPEELGA